MCIILINNPYGTYVEEFVLCVHICVGLNYQHKTKTTHSGIYALVCLTKGLDILTNPTTKQ